MNRVFVFDTNKIALAPCTPARANELLTKGKAAVYRYNPFTIILKREVVLDMQQPKSIRIDLGAEHTGFAIVGHFPKQGNVVLFSLEVNHRGKQVKDDLHTRSCIRRGRRGRNTRYREPSFDNRTRVAGWLAPSVKSIMGNVIFVVDKFHNLVSEFDKTYIELGKFDTQKLANKNIKVHEYSKGAKHKKSTYQALVDRDGEKCAYCDAVGVPLEKEHLVKRGSGSNALYNLVLSCRKCNEAKGNKPVKKFLKDRPDRYALVMQHTKKPMRGAGIMNSMRYQLVNELSKISEVECFIGKQTFDNRNRMGYDKEHWVDAACVGDDNWWVTIPKDMQPMIMDAKGRGNRQVIAVDASGNQRKNAKGELVRAKAPVKEVKGFRNNDYCKVELNGYTYYGNVSIRSSGSFVLKLGKEKEMIVKKEIVYRNKLECSYKYFTLLQHADGFNYHTHAA
jgi:hypothetical protein